jgi:ubiquinone biosynthesis protein
MFRAAQHSRRIFAILRVLARHDALFIFGQISGLAGILRFVGRLPGFTPMVAMRSKRPGERLAVAFEALGPAFVKFGQGLSTRSDLLGETVTTDLATLQDRLPPFSGEQARQAIEAELGGSVDELFVDFDDDAIAAASIAQVHFAAIRVEHDDGSETIDEVAVKVLRPGIEAAFARDLDLLAWTAELAERWAPKLRRLRPVETVATIAETVRLEMDLRLEAAAATQLAENFSASDIYRVPGIYWSHTGRRVLTASRIQGAPVHDADQLAALGLDLEAVVARAAEVFFTQVFEHGFFHADMHPGNLFVDADGGLIAVDFGIMGRVDRPTRNYLADMLVGFLSGDYRAVADIHFEAGLVPAHKDRGAFELALRAIGSPILGRPIHEISIARLLGQLFYVTEQFEMEAQPQLLLLQKTMLLAEGVGRQLAPHTNMWFLAQPLIENWVRDNRGPEARAAELLQDATQTLALIPAALRKIAELPVEPAVSARPVWPYWLAIGLLAVLLFAA